MSFGLAFGIFLLPFVGLGYCVTSTMHSCISEVLNLCYILCLIFENLLFHLFNFYLTLVAFIGGFISSDVLFYFFKTLMNIIRMNIYDLQTPRLSSTFLEIFLSGRYWVGNMLCIVESVRFP